MIRAQLRVVFGAATFFWEQDENQSEAEPDNRKRIKIPGQARNDKKKVKPGMTEREYEYYLYQTCIKG